MTKLSPPLTSLNACSSHHHHISLGLTIKSEVGEVREILGLKLQDLIQGLHTIFLAVGPLGPFPLVSLKEDIGFYELSAPAFCPREVRHWISLVAIIILVLVEHLCSIWKHLGKQSRAARECPFARQAILMKTKGWGVLGGQVLA